MTRSSAVFIVLLAFFALAAGADETATPVVTGFVFEDANGSRIRDPDEVGVSNVAVSDGVTLVTSGPDGAYVLETSPTPLPGCARKYVFVSAPSGFRLDSRGFYHDLGESVHSEARADFALQKETTDQETFRFVFITDMHIGEGKDKDATRLQAAIDEIRGLADESPVAFVVAGGDISYGRMDVFQGYIAQLEEAGMPVFNVPGNHDMNEDPAYTGPRKGRFNKYFGPTYYSFSHGGVHFVLLDTTEWQPGLGPQGVIGWLDTQRLNWLRSDLEQVPENQPIVVFCHIPIRCTAWHRSPEAKKWKPCWEVVNQRKVIGILRKHNVPYVFQGHMHENDVVTENGTAFACVGSVCGSWWDRDGTTRCIDGSPKGFLVGTVKGSRIEPVYRSTDGVEAFAVADEPSPSVSSSRGVEDPE
jgi:UDP-2,3-diacylglucosamine pyrophosphatase LpxH